MNHSSKLRLLAAILAAAGLLAGCGGGGGGGSSTDNGSENAPGGGSGDSGGTTDSGGGGGSGSSGDTGGSDGSSGGSAGGGSAGGGDSGSGDSGGGATPGDGTTTAASACLNTTVYNTASTSHLEYQISGLYTGTSVSDFTHRPSATFEGKTASEFTGDVTTNYVGVGTFHDNVQSYIQLDGFDLVRLGTLYDITASSISGEGKTMYSPAFRDRRYALAAGESFTATYDLISTQTFAGLPPTSTTATETVTVKYVGRESVTVPLGTFETCRFEINGGQTVQWDAVSSGLMVKSVSMSEGQALTLEMTVGTINGASIKP